MGEQMPRAVRLAEVEDAVALHWRRHGAPPTQNRIAELMELSDRTQVSKFVAQLLSRGRLVRCGFHGVMLASDRQIILDALRGKEWR